MGLIIGLLDLPLAPVRGTVWLAERIQEQAERELYDESAIRTGLAGDRAGARRRRLRRARARRGRGCADRAPDGAPPARGRAEPWPNQMTTGGCPPASSVEAALSTVEELTGYYGRGGHGARVGRRALADHGRRARALSHPQHDRRDGHLCGPARRAAGRCAATGGRALPARPGRRGLTVEERGTPDPLDQLPARAAGLADEPRGHPRAGARQGHRHRGRHPDQPARHRAAHDQAAAADRLGRPRA